VAASLIGALSVQHTRRAVLEYRSTPLSGGVRLVLIANASVIQPNHSIRIELEITNTLNIPVSYNFTENPQIMSWSLDDYMCGFNPSHFTLGYALYQGFITPKNITEATPLKLVPPNFLLCPYQFFGGTPQEVVLLPHSDNANVTLNFSFPPQVGYYRLLGTALDLQVVTYSCVTGQNNTDGSLDGYWVWPNMSQLFGVPTYGIQCAEKFFHPLTPAVYTVVAADFLNQTIYFHFQVQQDE